MRTKSKLNNFMKMCVHIMEQVKKEPNGTQNWIDITKIIVPNYFKDSIPNPYKVERYTQRYLENGYLDKPISVHRDLKELDDSVVFLSDGYIRYTIAKNFGLKFVPITYDNKGDSNE